MDERHAAEVTTGTGEADDELVGETDPAVPDDPEGFEDDLLDGYQPV